MVAKEHIYILLHISRMNVFRIELIIFLDWQFTLNVTKMQYKMHTPCYVVFFSFADNGHFPPP